MDTVNSTTFIKRPPCTSEKQECLLYAKEVLCGRLFLGFYKERRYVSIIKEYRDLVVISEEEVDLHNDIKKLRKKLMGNVGIKWVGITDPDVSTLKAYCFWVKLSNLPFGQYWFQIKHVKIIEEEILLTLKCIRKCFAPVTAVTSQLSKKQINNENEASNTENSIVVSVTKNSHELDVRKTLESTYKSCVETAHVIQPYITWSNLFAVAKVTCALILVFLTGVVSALKYLGDYLIKLTRELSVLVQAFTPIVIHLIDFFSKVVGGFYILLAGIFIRNGRRYAPQFVPNNNNVRVVPFQDVAKVPVDWKKRNQILRQELLCNQKPF